MTVLVMWIIFMWISPRKGAETYASAINDTIIRRYRDIKERDPYDDISIGILKRGKKVKLIDFNLVEAGIMLKDGTLGLVNFSDIEIKKEGPVYIDFSDSGSIKELLFLISLFAAYVLLGRIKRKRRL
jgi:hypothetical protein